MLNPKMAMTIQIQKICTKKFQIVGLLQALGIQK